MTDIKKIYIYKIKLYSPPRKLKAGNKSPALLLKIPLCMGDLSPAHKIFIERPVIPFIFFINNKKKQQKTNFVLAALITILLGHPSSKSLHMNLWSCGISRSRGKLKPLYL